MVNITNFTAIPLDFYQPSGLVALVIGIVLIVAAFYLFFKVIKNLIANAVLGGIGLIVLHFAGPYIGITVPIDIINIIIAIVAGVPGLAIIIVFTIVGL